VCECKRIAQVYSCDGVGVRVLLLITGSSSAGDF
jgi:hypothetical protein